MSRRPPPCLRPATAARVARPVLRPLLLAGLLALAPAAGAAPGQTAAEKSAAAASALQAAIDSLQTAEGASNRVAALTLAIRAYEEGLAATRDAVRQVAQREEALRAELAARQAEIARVLGVMAAIGADPAPARYLHPGGPLAAARAGTALAEVIPALQEQADLLRARLQEIGALGQIEARAEETLKAGLGALQAARTDLSQAIAERRDLPQRFTEDPAVMRALLESQDTLDDFAVALAGKKDVVPGEGDFALAKGELPLPVDGRLLRGWREADAAGIRRPGMVIETRPRALVTAPYAATIRYRGPLLDYGNVMILEPAGGYLIVLAGLDVVYGEIGQVIPEGTPVGLMGGEAAEAAEFLDTAGAAEEAPQTLYIELRQGGGPVNPEEWFAQTRMFP